MPQQAIAISPETENAGNRDARDCWRSGSPELVPCPGMLLVRSLLNRSPDNSLSFDRVLSVSGEAQLIRLYRFRQYPSHAGSGNEVHIHGQIHVSHDGSEEQARQIAANPPIEQSGNVIRVGQQHEEHWRWNQHRLPDRSAGGNSPLELPPVQATSSTRALAKTPSFETGSGDIRANGLQGAFEVKTGSGNITADQTGQGDVKAETGSGNIEIKDLHGSFRGQNGFG